MRPPPQLLNAQHAFTPAPQDPKTTTMPSRPGVQLQNSPGARCSSVWIITIMLPQQCGHIRDTSTCWQRSAGLAGPACPGRGELVHRAVDMRHPSQGAGHVPGQESWLPAGPGGQRASPLLVGPQGFTRRTHHSFPWAGPFPPISSSWGEGTLGRSPCGRFAFGECWDLHLHRGRKGPAPSRGLQHRTLQQMQGSSTHSCDRLTWCSPGHRR